MQLPHLLAEVLHVRTGALGIGCLKRVKQACDQLTRYRTQYRQRSRIQHVGVQRPGLDGHPQSLWRSDQGTNNRFQHVGFKVFIQPRGVVGLLGMKPTDCRANGTGLSCSHFATGEFRGFGINLLHVSELAQNPRTEAVERRDPCLPHLCTCRAESVQHRSLRHTELHHRALFGIR